MCMDQMTRGLVLVPDPVVEDQIIFFLHLTYFFSFLYHFCCIYIFLYYGIIIGVVCSVLHIHKCTHTYTVNTHTHKHKMVDGSILFTAFLCSLPPSLPCNFTYICHGWRVLEKGFKPLSALTFVNEHRHTFQCVSTVHVRSSISMNKRTRWTQGLLPFISKESTFTISVIKRSRHRT